MPYSIKGSTNIDKVCRKRKNPPNLIEYAAEQRHTGVFNDIVVRAGNTNFSASALVLSCCSPVLEKKIKSGPKHRDNSSVIEVENVDKHSMRSLIEYIYTGSIYISSENACDLLASAVYLQIDEVRRFCLDYLSAALSPENCFVILNLAQKYDSVSLLEAVNAYIADKFQDVVCSRSFRSLSRDELVSFITSQKKNVVPEISLYKAIVTWTKYDSDKRTTGFNELLSLVVLEKFAKEELEEVSNENLITESLSCSKQLIDAYSSQTLLAAKKNKVYGSRILSIGGNNTSSKVIGIYDCAITKNEIKVVPDLPEPKDCGCAVILNQCVYYIGGRYSNTGEFSSIVWGLDMRADVWEWQEACPLLSERCVMGAAAFDGGIAVAGGWGRPGSLATAEFYQPEADRWHNIRSLKISRSGNALVTCKKSLYCLGGFSENKFLSSVERINSVNGTWESVKAMNSPRRWLAAVELGQDIYAIGGQAGKSDQSRLRSAERYDIEKNRWCYISDMHCHRCGCSACVMRGKIFVAGGFDIDGSVVREIERYDPWADKWEIVGETNIDLFHHSIISLA